MIADLNNIGIDTQTIVKELLKNENLRKLLKNTERNPLQQTLPTIETLMNKNILVIPNVNSMENTESRIVVLITNGDIDKSITDLYLKIYIYVPYKEWLIVGNQLRPFAIMSEISNSISELKINTLGQLKFTNFSVSSLGDEVGCYTMSFEFHEYI